MGVLTGMRSDELAGIEVNAGRSQVLDGTTFHWVRSIEHKTKKGAVEYLMPEVGIRILQIMERWSAPVRAKLQLRIADLERQSSGKQNSELLKKLATARADVKRLFLTTARGRSGATTMSGIGWHKTMRKFSRDAGCDWLLAPHQLSLIHI